jgi:hypothetical protein
VLEEPIDAGIVSARRAGAVGVECQGYRVHDLLSVG